jgi:ParB family transcriptional regulator, chromosome partitioning protein
MRGASVERKGLGRGLSALLADIGPEGAATATAARPAGEAPAPVTRLPIERLEPNPVQPRRTFDDAELDELTASIREKGVLQPLIVRPHPSREAAYEIVAGERRWRAAQRAQVHELPVVVRDFSDAEVLEVAIIENVQRADLNPLEEAQGYRQLMDRFGHTQEKLAEALGKSRSHIANLLRLLTLPEGVLELLRSGRLTAGHARALITAPDPVALAKEVVDRDLSVRETEALARRAAAVSPARPAPGAVTKDADTRALEQDLAAALGLPVTIQHKPGGRKGELRIRYRTLEELDGLCQLLSR